MIHRAMSPYRRAKESAPRPEDVAPCHSFDDVPSARRLRRRGATLSDALERRAGDDHALTLAGVLALARGLVAAAGALALAGVDAVALVGALCVAGVASVPAANTDAAAMMADFFISTAPSGSYARIVR